MKVKILVMKTAITTAIRDSNFEREDFNIIFKTDIKWAIIMTPSMIATRDFAI